jgi:hypothetical protein
MQVAAMPLCLGNFNIHILPLVFGGTLQNTLCNLRFHPCADMQSASEDLWRFFIGLCDSDVAADDWPVLC